MNKLINAILVLMVLIFVSGCNKPLVENEVEVVETDKDMTTESEDNGGDEMLVIEVPTEENISDTDSETVDKDSETDLEEVEEAVEPVPVINYEELQVNEMGHILVVMYHGIKDNPPYHRTAEDFLKDLEYMYDHGYRLIGLEAYFSGKIEVEAGYTPILLTFDDGLPSTFALEEVDGQLEVKADTAVGIMEQFIEEHPDFGRGSVFFINNNGSSTFYGDGTLLERFEWLIDHGYDIGNHTSAHLNLSTLGAESIQSEIGKVDQVIKELLPNYQVLGLSYPFGIRPVESLRAYALEGSYKDIPYAYSGGFAVGPTSAYVPVTHKDFYSQLIPRTRGSEGEFGDLWYYFDYYDTHPEKRYISDGEAETIVIPENYVELISDSAADSFEIIVYETQDGESAQ